MTTNEQSLVGALKKSTVTIEAQLAFITQAQQELTKLNKELRALYSRMREDETTAPVVEEVPAQIAHADLPDTGTDETPAPLAEVFAPAVEEKQHEQDFNQMHEIEFRDLVLKMVDHLPKGDRSAVLKSALARIGLASFKGLAKERQNDAHKALCAALDEYHGEKMNG